MLDEVSDLTNIIGLAFGYSSSPVEANPNFLSMMCAVKATQIEGFLGTNVKSSQLENRNSLKPAQRY